MHYELAGPEPLPDAETLVRLLHAVDPAALVDRNPLTGGLRVSSVVGTSELATVLDRAGVPDAGSRITRLPSECCGGCGG